MIDVQLISQIFTYMHVHITPTNILSCYQLVLANFLSLSVPLSEMLFDSFTMMVNFKDEVHQALAGGPYR